MRGLVVFGLLAFTLALTTPAAFGSVLCVQEELAALGYDPGPADGLMGRRTAAAATEFAAAAGLAMPPLGEATAPDWCAQIKAWGLAGYAQRAAQRELALLPRAELMTVTHAGRAGRVTISGEPGSVPARRPLVALNLNTGQGESTTAEANGAFSVSLQGEAGASFEVYSIQSERAFLTAPQDFQGLGTLVYNSRPRIAADGSVEFVTSGGVGGRTGEWVFQGRLADTSFARGDPLSLDGVLTLRSPSIGAPFDDMTYRVRAVWLLAPLSDAAGHPNFMPFDHLGFSPLLAPTGLGIKGVSNVVRIGETTVFSTQVSRAGDRLSMPLRIDADPAFRMPDGYYAVGLELFIGRTPSAMRPLHDNGLLGTRAPQGIVAEVTHPHWTGAAIRIGDPAALRVPMVLLWNTLSDGSRGVVSREDQPHFSLRNKVVFEAPHFVVPREDTITGEPIAYRLEPFLPTMFQNNKANVYVPPIQFSLPSGALQVTVERPDGTVDDLGSAPFRQYRMGETDRIFPSHKYGETSVMMPLELTTLDPRFSYRFDQYGRHLVTVEAMVEDAYGHAVEGGGTYEIWVAKPLNVVETGVFLGTPFEVGDYYAPGLRVEPGVPADVVIDFTLHKNSSLENLQRHRFSGTANSYGYFQPPAGTAPLKIEAPGEYVVDVTAKYWDPDGTLWMGSRRGANVVETPNGQLVAHGRRAMDRFALPNRPQWFFLNDSADFIRSIGVRTPSFTFPTPFSSGDVVWAGDFMFDLIGNGEIAPVVRLQDLRGDIAAEIASRDPGRIDGNDGTMAELVESGETPIFTWAPVRPENPVPDYADYRQWSYFYQVTMRPGVAVRAILNGDDRGGFGKYWTFGDPYNLQPGMGANGDLPGDIKLMFGGAVYRDLDRGINQYAIHGTMAVIVDNADPLGERTAPPFRGAGGGPDGGPLLTIRGEEIDLFVTPTGVRPGEVLEVGDTFSFAGQFWPLLASKLTVTVRAPDGSTHTQTGQANKIGYYYDPSAEFVVDQPGRWMVTVEGLHDGPISAGQVGEPFPTGGVLGSRDGSYDFYVVPADGRKPVLTAAWTQPATSPLVLGDAAEDAEARVYFTATLPGLILAQGELPVADGVFSYTYDPVALHEFFPNIDIRDQSNRGPTPQSVDVVTVTFLIETERGHTVRRVLLEGETLIQDVANAFPVDQPLRNVARLARVRASRALGDQPPAQAVDGDFESSWGSGDGPSQWIELALEGPTEVHEISLAVAQYPAGQTRHRIRVTTLGNPSLSTVHEFDGFTQDPQVLKFAPDTPIQDVVSIRIETTRSPSWVAWREISVIGRPE